MYYRYYLRPSRRFTKLEEKNASMIMDKKNPEFMGHQESKFSGFAEISSDWANIIPAGVRSQLLTHSPLLKKPTH